ncbi:uncharacterized protein BDR25DRAFT_358545 [Lindgomyces ingoldianus]|uniref:Uncharacterized protein n=1 Tax=Lindgomyces ingoldianus TaxID=673940 RepID=A0ACB6QMS5_9PLEO|nr:uncharacterized protein BDR25DRAFT_358545 [Lindgomyces ingoldianus]KAF2467422.1 hypothetical protein BDR25DRAFT_358545 [Lindgomyces ingoldianus]
MARDFQCRISNVTLVWNARLRAYFQEIDSKSMYALNLAVTLISRLHTADILKLRRRLDTSARHQPAGLDLASPATRPRCTTNRQFPHSLDTSWKVSPICSPIRDLINSQLKIGPHATYCALQRAGCSQIFPKNGREKKTTFLSLLLNFQLLVKRGGRPTSISQPKAPGPEVGRFEKNCCLGVFADTTTFSLRTYLITLQITPNHTLESIVQHLDNEMFLHLPSTSHRGKELAMAGNEYLS